MFKIQFYIISFILLLSLVSCKPKAIELKAYYYPLEQLSEGLVYQYYFWQDTIDQATALAGQYEYWSLSSTPKAQSISLQATYYDAFFNEQQRYTDFLGQDAVIREKYSLKSPNGEWKDADIVFNLSYPLVCDTTRQYYYKMSWQDENGTNTISRNRKINLSKSKFPDTLAIDVLETIENDNGDGVFEQQFFTVEYYEKNKGLVYSQKDFGNGEMLKSRLEAIITFAEFESMKSK